MSGFEQLSLEGTGLGNALISVLEGQDIQPGDDPSYQLCKTLYLYHPLGKKLVDAPIELAQSKPREITVKDHPDEVKEAFEQKWEAMGAEALVFNEHHTSRMYGIGSLVAVMEGEDEGKPLAMEDLWKSEEKLKFNVLDPLNTAGSLVLSQIPTGTDFQRPVRVSSAGHYFHRTRFHVTMNEMPIYLAYTNAAFGFVGRSVFQRTLYPLKSFLQTMRSDDVITNKNAMIVYTALSPGSIISEVMQLIGAAKRKLIRFGRNGNVLTIGQNEKIETLDMQHVAQSGEFARNNVLKNIAAGASMPAIMVNDETLVSGLADGTEDAKVIARFGEHFRFGLIPSYKFLDNYCQYLAWSPPFIERMQAEHPALYNGKSRQEIFASWRKAFSAVWPSLLQESESEKAQREQVKASVIVSLLATLMDRLDPEGQLKLIVWAQDNLNESELLLPHELNLDEATLEQWLEEQAQQKAAMPKAGAEGPEGGMKLPMQQLRALRTV